MKDKQLLVLKISFWVIFFGTLLNIPLILFLNSKSLIPPWLIQSDKIFSEIIYSNGLYLVFSIIGFLVAAIIFLMEFISSRYRTEELDSMPIFKKYFMTTLFLFFVIIIFNLWALYSEAVYPYTLISLIFSASVLLLISTTILFVLFNLKVSVILGMLSDQISKFITKKKDFKRIPALGDISYSDEFINALKNKVSIFIKNSINAVRNNQDTIFKESLNNIRKIAKEYLKNSKHIQATEDTFLDELNDQFNFIIFESLNSSNQKILEDIAETIGAISLDIIEYRRGIGDINNFALNWLATLKDLFIKSYSKDRTIVCHICIEKINNVILLTLDKGFYRSYNTYKMFIDDISDILSKVNQHWPAILLQKALLMYQYQFLKFLELSKENKMTFSDFFIKQYFDKLAQIINETKINHKSFGNNAIIFASLYGVDSFAQKIAKLGLKNIQNEKIKRNIAFYLKELIEFNRKIMDTDPDKNDNRVYDSFSELLFLISKYADLTENDKGLLTKTLSNNLLVYIKKRYLNALKKYDSKLYEIKDVTVDYFALLIYLNRKNPDIINEIMKKLVGIYDLIRKGAKNENQQMIFRSLYKEIKLYSCWIDLFPNLKDVNKPIIKILIKDFYEPKFPHRISIPSLFEKYGYPENNIGRLSGLWYLHPSYMWGNIFQDKIAEKLNGKEEKHYIQFHNMLKSSKKKGETT